jgi:HK97 family phage prohead protease/HK97 family phage major capsid protein
MINKVFNLTSTFKALHEDDDGSVHICGMASTHDEDRANDVIMAEAWTKGGLGNFEKNPIILFNHDYNKPIGRATGLKVTENGLELKAKISKAAPDHVAQLVKEGILGAFSVGFRVKDADYITETDGLKIKDAELFEVSVVSVPCNQAATFSLAKSFDSMDEYNEFKKTFTNRVDLAGQSLAKDENSSVASETPDEAEISVKQEIKMSEEVQTPEIDLEAFAKKVAEETAAKIAMKQAEQKAADDAAAQEVVEKAQAEAEAKAQQTQEVQAAIKVGVESGADRLMADVEAKMAEKDADMAQVIEQYKKDLEEKSVELEKMRESKRVFADRSSNDLEKHSKDLMYAHMLGVFTNKGWDTQYGRDTLEKAGMAYPSANSGTPALATSVQAALEKEVQFQYRLAQAFRELTMPSQSMVLPLQSDTSKAVFHTGGESERFVGGTANSGAGTGVTNDGGTAGTFDVSQIVLQAHRMISTTFLDNHIDEELLVNLLPMMTENVARAHARAVDDMILNGVSSPAITGVATMATNVTLSAANQVSLSAADSLTAAALLEARSAMGKYGLSPTDVTFIVSQKRYYDLIADPGFADITDVGSDVATKLVGAIGSVYGSPVLISDNFAATETTSTDIAYAINTSNFVIPRLRGVSVEQDYEVREQRRLVVASQSLGFDRLFGGNNVNNPAAMAIKPVT